MLSKLKAVFESAKNVVKKAVNGVVSLVSSMFKRHEHRLVDVAAKVMLFGGAVWFTFALVEMVLVAAPMLGALMFTSLAAPACMTAAGWLLAVYSTSIQPAGMDADGQAVEVVEGVIEADAGAGVPAEAGGDGHEEDRVYSPSAG